MTKASIVAALASHDSSALLDIIKANPTYDSVHDLTHSFIDVAQSNPADVQEIADTILTVRNAPDAPSIDTGSTQRELRDLLSRELFEMLTTAFGSAGEEKSTVAPQDPFLISALISGACARSKLSNSAAQAGMVTRGLQFDGSEYELYFAADAYEVNAVHACLQLLVGGAVGLTTGQLGYDKENVLPALKSIQNKDVVKSANAKRLLELTIQQTEDGFKTDLSPSEIWAVLFPETRI